jgi:hypothetical protein
MVRFQLRHGNDLLAMDSLRNCDVSTLSWTWYTIGTILVYNEKKA